MNYNDLPVFYKKLDENYNVVNGGFESATYTNVDSNFVLVLILHDIDGLIIKKVFHQS